MSVRLQFFGIQLALLGLWVSFPWLVSGCSGNLTAGYRTVTAISHARDATSKALVGVCQPKHLECVDEYGIKTEGYKRCIEKCSKALQYWSLIGFPSIQAALRLTIASLEVAYQAKKKETNWIKYAKPGVCAIVKAVDEFKELIGEKGKTILGYLRIGSQFVCTE
jgi:hypothetical protein